MNPEDRYHSCAELLYALYHYEEADDSYRNKQKKKVNIFAGFAATALLCFVVGIAGLLLKGNAQNNDYENNMIQAAAASNNEERIEYYLKAIDIKPTETEAYLELVEAFKDDATFSVEEEAELKKKINANLASLQEEDDYANLAYEIGKLYWYYYDYGNTGNSDNQITRMKSAIQWFDDAYTYGSEDSDYYIITQAYREIGQFNRDVTLKVEEAEDKGTYAPYFDSLKNMYAIVSEEENEIVNLETYKLCMYSIENYARKFMLDEISQEDLTEFYQNVHSAVAEIDPTTEKTEAMKEEIMERETYARQAIEHAYAE